MAQVPVKLPAHVRWEQFKKARKEGWLAENVVVGISEQWMGGEIWHSWVASRGRMREYALELERKIAEGKLAQKNTGFVLALCGDGFLWGEDRLEDFVSFYCSGAHRQDDAFAKMEQKHISDRKISLARTITSFANMKRKQGESRHSRLNWNVRPPRDPFV